MKGLEANLRQPGDSGQLAHGSVCGLCLTRHLLTLGKMDNCFVACSKLYQGIYIMIKRSTHALER